MKIAPINFRFLHSSVILQNRKNWNARDKTLSHSVLLLVDAELSSSSAVVKGLLLVLFLLLLRGLIFLRSGLRLVLPAAAGESQSLSIG